MRISKGADRAVGKYMEIFVREAIARAAFERSGGEEGRGRGRGMGDGFMEVGLCPGLLDGLIDGGREC